MTKIILASKIIPRELTKEEIESNKTVQLLQNTPNFKPFAYRLAELGVKHTPSNGEDGVNYYLDPKNAEQSLPSLLMKPIHISSDLEHHRNEDGSMKTIGVVFGSRITRENDSAFIDVIAGLWDKDYPEDVAFISSNKNDIGSSYELVGKEKEIDAKNTSLYDYKFTGSAILFKENAALSSTKILYAERKNRDKLKKKLQMVMDDNDISEDNKDVEDINDAMMGDMSDAEIEKMIKELKDMYASKAASKNNSTEEMKELMAMMSIDKINISKAVEMMKAMGMEEEKIDSMEKLMKVHNESKDKKMNMSGMIEMMNMMQQMMNMAKNKSTTTGSEPITTWGINASKMAETFKDMEDIPDGDVTPVGEVIEILDDEIDLEAKKLTTDERNALGDESFALIQRKRSKDGKILKIRRFPIPDKSHAIQALRMLNRADDVSEEEKKSIKRKIYAKYPALKKGTKEGSKKVTDIIDMKVKKMSEGKHIIIESSKLELAKGGNRNMAEFCEACDKIFSDLLASKEVVLKNDLEVADKFAEKDKALTSKDGEITILKAELDKAKTDLAAQEAKAIEDAKSANIKEAEFKAEDKWEKVLKNLYAEEKKAEIIEIQKKIYLNEATAEDVEKLISSQKQVSILMASTGAAGDKATEDKKKSIIDALVEQMGIKDARKYKTVL